MHGGRLGSIEAPTWLVWAATAALWLGITAGWASLPWWAIVLVGGWTIAWHGSLQHEAIHGHPTRSARLNHALVGWPLALWLPFGIYRDEHLAHHATGDLTHPAADPESFYVGAERWRATGPLGRVVRQAGFTLAGRLLMGPAAMVLRFMATEPRRLWADPRRLAHWRDHLLMAAPVTAWLLWCGVPLGEYLLLAVYPGMSLTLLRSFAEHRPGGATPERSAVVEAHPLWALLFLNNNLHVVHHAEPERPWYQLPARFAQERTRWLAANGGFRFAGYGEVARRYALTPSAHPLHPDEIEPDAWDQVGTRMIRS